jgi:hypothetical protein
VPESAQHSNSMLFSCWMVLFPALVVLCAGGRAAAAGDLVGTLRLGLEGPVARPRRPAQRVATGCILPVPPAPADMTCNHSITANGTSTTFCCWEDFASYACHLENGTMSGTFGCGSVRTSCAAVPVCEYAQLTASPSGPTPAPQTESPSDAIWVAPKVLAVLGALIVVLV